MRIIGIDPGLRNMGWGVIDQQGSKLRHVANGTCKSGVGDLSERLACLYQMLSKVFDQYQPDTAAVEHTFVNKDAAGTLKLGQARAVPLIIPGLRSIPVAEYAPNAVKKAVVGVGHADKDQVAHMVKLLLPGVKLDSADSTDALALSICHAHRAGDRMLKIMESVK